jgi:hypothetical protein
LKQQLKHTTPSSILMESMLQVYEKLNTEKRPDGTYPLVETYGETRLSELDENLTYGFDALKAAKYREVWMVDLKRGEYYRFKDLAEKLKKAYESLGTGSFVVYNNVFHTTGGSDVALVCGFNSYDEWSKDMGAMKAFEKLYGTGSWQNMLKEWNEIVVDYNVEIRSLVK